MRKVLDRLKSNPKFCEHRRIVSVGRPKHKAKSAGSNLIRAYIVLLTSRIVQAGSVFRPRFPNDKIESFEEEAVPTV